MIGPDIEIRFLGAKGKNVQIGITAPGHHEVLRSDIANRSPKRAASRSES